MFVLNKGVNTNLYGCQIKQGSWNFESRLGAATS